MSAINAIGSDCLALILHYADEYTLAEACGDVKARMLFNQKILRSFEQNPHIARFVPKALPLHNPQDLNEEATEVTRRVEGIYEAIMKSKHFIQCAPSDRLSQINEIIGRYGEGSELRSLTLSDLLTVAELIGKQEDTNLVEFFTSGINQIYREGTVRLTGDDHQKAETIRTWMNENPALLERVRQLVMGICTPLPIEILRFQNLSKLVCMFCELRQLPSELAKLPLRHLDLRNNYLESIPSAIEQIKSLEFLDISSNPIQQKFGFFRKYEINGEKWTDTERPILCLWLLLNVCLFCLPEAITWICGYKTRMNQLPDFSDSDSY